MGSDPSRSGGEQLRHAWRGLCMLSGSSFLSGVGRRAVCAEPDLCKSHGSDRSSFISCSSHAPLHVHTSKRQHVHRHSAAERNLGNPIRVVSRSFGGERRRGDAGAWEAHGARRHGFRDVAQNRNPSSKTEVRCVWGFGGGEKRQNFDLT